MERRARALTLRGWAVTVRDGLPRGCALSGCPRSERPRRLARPRTPPFHGDNTGSNPVGDANRIKSLHRVSPDIRGCKKPHFGVLFAPSRWVRYAVPIMSSSSAEIVIGKNGASTAACAACLAGATACVYTSIVVRNEE